MPYKDKETGRSCKRVYRQENREKIRARDRAYHQANREKLNARTRANSQASYQALTAEALRVLGNKCACPGCEVSEPAFLTIDHINGRTKGSRHSALSEAKASGWDKTRFQILCANCNMTKSDRGFCHVHQKGPGQRNGHEPAANVQQALWATKGGDAL